MRLCAWPRGFYLPGSAPAQSFAQWGAIGNNTTAAKGMIDQELLDILVCPETKQPVRLADQDLLKLLNAAIDAGDVADRGGNAVESKIEEGLVREDRLLLYPIRDDIPIMLIDEAIPLDGIVAVT